MHTENEDLKPYACGKCDFRTKSKAYLKGHIDGQYPPISEKSFPVIAESFQYAPIEFLSIPPFNMKSKIILGAKVKDYKLS